MILIRPGFSIGADEIGKTGAAMPDGCPQDLSYGSDETCCLRQIQCTTTARWMDLRQEQCFTGIDVSHSRNTALIQEKRLDLLPALSQHRPEPDFVKARAQRVFAQATYFGDLRQLLDFVNGEEPETAVVPVVQFRGIGKLYDGMSVVALYRR